MDQYNDYLRAADRPFFSSFCDLWPRDDAHSGRRPGTLRWEPDFCVLPGEAITARKAAVRETGGLW